MLSRELRLAAVVTGVSLLLSFVSYRILLTGTYLDGIAALGLVILATVVSSLVLHFRKTAPLPAANPVSVEAASATVARSFANDLNLSPVAAGFVAVVMFAVIANGEVRKQVDIKPTPSATSAYPFHHTVSFRGGL